MAAENRSRMTTVPRTLDLLITSVATQLMQANAATVVMVIEQVMARLVEQFDVDAVFLRHNDHTAGVSILVAEWPHRCNRPRRDPLRVASFTSADPVFAFCQHGKEPAVLRPGPAHHAYKLLVAESRRSAPRSVAVAPLISEDVTTGVLGFLKFGAKKWRPKQLNALEATASLFAQLQARLAAEARLHQRVDKLRHLAEHDDLTDLNNRRAFTAHLSSRLAKGQPGPVAVFYLDLDRLKSVNDYFGHAVGDWYIKRFAERLRAHGDSFSMIARLGGDEFVAVPTDAMWVDTAESFALRLRRVLSDRVTIHGHVIARTVSIGVAVGRPGGDCSADLIRRADEAVLAAKRAGGNQVVVATDDMSFKRAFRNDIELHLEDAIASDGLHLNYQPEVDLRTGAIVATEALVRWEHPTRGLLLPDSFIGAAESINLAGELGKWVMRRAFTDFSRWRSNGVGLSALLRINVSPAQLVSREFVRDVADIIDEFDIDSDAVCLEMTERAVVRDTEATRRTLAELKEVGVQLAIDDFGTGYAVLSHLKSLPVDTLKIDAGFVRELGINAGDLAIVRAVIGLSEAFELQVVAEGVETPIAAQTLTQHGCYRAQGYLLSRPVTADAMESLFSEVWIPMPFLSKGSAVQLRAI